MKRLFDEEEVKALAGGGGGSATLYEHNIHFNITDFPTSEIYCSIYSFDKTPFTTKTFISWLNKRDYFKFGFNGVVPNEVMILSVIFQKDNTPTKFPFARIYGSWAEGGISQLTINQTYDMREDSFAITDNVSQR